MMSQKKEMDIKCCCVCVLYALVLSLSKDCFRALKSFNKFRTSAARIVYPEFIEGSAARWKKGALLFFLILTNYLTAEQLTFHNLLSATWYEKGLNSTIFVWNKVCAVLDQDKKEPSQETFDILLGRFAFAHFCLEKMYQHKQCVIDEDIAYLARLLLLLEHKLMSMSTDSKCHERMECLARMVHNMKRSLQVPPNI